MQETDPKIYNELYQLTLVHLTKGLHADDIKDELVKHGADVLLAAIVIAEAKKEHYEKLRKEGFRFILAGCLIGLCGCLLTLINYNTSRSIDFAMYGLTSLGLAVVFWGLFRILG